MSLYRGAGIPPAEVYLEQKYLRAAAPVRRLGKRHPLVRRSNICAKDTVRQLQLRVGQKDRPYTVPERCLTSLQINMRQITASEGLGKLYSPKHVPKLSFCGFVKEVTEKARNRLKTLPPLTICACSDASSRGLGQSTWGCAMYQDFTE